MNVHLSEESRRFVADQVASGRYPSEDAVLEDALVRMRQQEPQPSAPGVPAKDPILGMFRDDPELIDQIVAEAMRIREERPWRLPAGE
jgi:Arc/MetJ-type ribon-helix-helix transcriptional regulator